jgi:hypothetical protein
MPKPLPARWRPECIREFRASARQRFDDGMALAAAGRRTGAIYMWGYCAEMLLKAAYFSLKGFSDNAPITWKADIAPAIHWAKTFHKIAWKGNSGHDVIGWAELLVAERAATAPPHPLGREVQAYGQRIGRTWSESLRYHKNVAYGYEVTQVREAAEWLLAHAGVL